MTPSSSTEYSDFSMPFGTSIVPKNGGVLFRLWAPEADNVELCLMPGTDAEDIIPMTKQENGWFSLHHPGARVGDFYLFRIDRNIDVPDPASRYQKEDIHGPSVICDPLAYDWQDQNWHGRPWTETIIYELHVGTFSPQGNFNGVTERLDYLIEVGITAIELMPVAQFPGLFNWGYDGTLLFAPCNSYGTPQELKKLIDTAHQKGVMVFLDVVYNHFGPEGNYLYVYARDAFFTEEKHTPWGAAIDFEGPESKTVREFFTSNVRYWLEEYHFDGLRFDAVHTIFDQSRPDILEEIALQVAQGCGNRRHVHLILENDNNCPRYLARDEKGHPRYYSAQWNDDLHHACHVLLTGETEGYYIDYADRPMHHLGKCLTEGFAYQGEFSRYRDNQKRGQPSAHLPPDAFVSFLQNHDQIGNRAFGERLISLSKQEHLEIMTALVLLAPSPPLLFMGEEFGSTTPFCFFSNFGPDIASNVTEGRRREFEQFAQFRLAENRERIPDPNAETTFLMSKLDWLMLEQKKHQSCLDFYCRILAIRKREIIPRLAGMQKQKGVFEVSSNQVLQAWWYMGDGSLLTVILNLNDTHIEIDQPISGKILCQIPSADQGPHPIESVPPKSLIYSLKMSGERYA